MTDYIWIYYPLDSNYIHINKKANFLYKLHSINLFIEDKTAITLIDFIYAYINLLFCSPIYVCTRVQ